MDSGITNIAKLSPATVVKTDERPSADVKTGAEPVSSTDLTVAATKLKQDKEKKTDSKPPLELVNKAADEGNTLFQAVKRNLQFEVDDTTKELVVKIVDSDSGEVVKQIPSEEMLALVKRMKEMEGQQGWMIQDRA